MAPRRQTEGPAIHKPINRHWFLIASLALLAGLVVWFGEALPLSREIAAVLQVNPYGRAALLNVTVLLTVAWALQVLPWGYVLARRMVARRRAPMLAAVPVALSGLGLVGLAIAGAFLGGPTAGFQSPDGALFNTWHAESFSVLNLTLQSCKVSGMLAAISGLILGIEALRPDAQSEAEVFS
ncbi:MAG: hypothetical protein AAF439_10385 [Pseudomonadota bacterium]